MTKDKGYIAAGKILAQVKKLKGKKKKKNWFKQQGIMCEGEPDTCACNAPRTSTNRCEDLAARATVI